jgi:hypothetical protein
MMHFVECITCMQCSFSGDAVFKVEYLLPLACAWKELEHICNPSITLGLEVLIFFNLNSLWAALTICPSGWKLGASILV